MKINVIRKVLEVNDRLADEIREKTNLSKTLVVNIMSSPGSGKTSILEKILPLLTEKGYNVGVIEGDIATIKDAQRISNKNIPVTQINTDKFGGDCHLGSEVILPALETFDLEKMDIVIIENVGNLVCPAEFDTGSDYNIVVISTTEGEDKPLKYPLMFRVCQFGIINKIDLLPYLDFDISELKTNIKNINPNMEIVESSAKTNKGIAKIINWFENHLK